MELLLAIAVVCVQSVSAGQHTTTRPAAFSGTWVLDPARSVLYGGIKRELELVIVSGPSSIKVTERRPSGQDEYSVAADGLPHEHTFAGGVFSRRVAREKGDLVFRVTMTRLADNATIRYTERWSLSDDGRTLTIYTAYPGGRDVLKVFTRKDQ